MAIEMSLSNETQALYNDALLKMLEVINKQDLKVLNPRMLAFFISIYGKNSLVDWKFTEMKEIMLKHIRNGKASIIDIVETFNACLTLNDFSNSDLNAANLASDTSMAEKLMD